MLMANIANDKQNRDSRLLSVRWNIPDNSSRFDDLPTSASVFIEWGSAQQAVHAGLRNKRCLLLLHCCKFKTLELGYEEKNSQ